MLIIKGYCTIYSSKRNSQEYARFENNERLEAYRYLNQLKTGCLGNICKFWMEKECKTNE